MKRKDWTLKELTQLPKTKKEAIKRGNKYYYSGTSCQRGHVAATVTSENRCVECRREDVKLCAQRRRRRLGTKIQEILMPLQPGIRINNLTSTGGFERRHIKGKNQNYTIIYHEVKCDCGEMFWINNSQWGQQIQCRKCSNQKKLKLAQKSRQERAFISGHRSTTIEGTLLYSARNRARRRRLGMEFDLTITDIKIPEYCPILGIKLDSSLKGTRNHNPRFNAPSLDRINPNLGYTKDNVQVVSFRANNLKKDGTASEHLKVAEFMERMGVIE